MSPRLDLEGERVAMVERMIVAPVVGVFRPLDVEDGATVSVGEIVAWSKGRNREPVRSAFEGVVMGSSHTRANACAKAKAVAWMRVA